MQKKPSSAASSSGAVPSNADVSENSTPMTDKQIVPPPPPPGTIKQNIKGNKCRAQETILDSIHEMESEINKIYRKKDAGLLTLDEKNSLKKKETDLDALKKKLKSKQLDQARQKKLRFDKKRRLEEVFEEHPELKRRLGQKETPGRPTLEDKQPELLSAIINLATTGGAADERRRSEKIRTVKTLDDLTNELKKIGFTLSRSGVYLRLLPRNSLSAEGKRHVNTVPLKLIRSQNDQHTQHVDTKFCRATINNMEDIASTLGPNEVAFLSNDDKARIQLGLTAANKQAPLLMHLEYRMKLPDHDWVIAPKHKLVPSVYAGIVIEKGKFQDAVSYSGPTFVAIRSGKHSSSTAYSHLRDINSLYERPCFDGILKESDGSAKPIFMATVDGGPDENPRYQKTIACTIDHFVNYNLDAIFIATNAPGRSAFNRVERRMAPLSHDLAGLILPHDHFGSHLDHVGKTINDDLEKQNFAHAGKILASIWSSTVIDGYPVESSYIDPSEADLLPPRILKDAEWKKVHVRESQYMTQVVKCNDRGCCSAPRSSYFNIVKDRFLPPPLPLSQTSEGLKVIVDATAEAKFPSVFTTMQLKKEVLPRSAQNFQHEIPYDFACPSVQNQLTHRVCRICGLYHATLTSLKQHTSVCGNASEIQKVPKLHPQRLAARRQRELMCVIKNMWDSEDIEWHNEEDVDVQGLQVPNEIQDDQGSIPILNAEEIINKNPFTTM